MRYLFCCNTLRGFCNFRLDVVAHLVAQGNEAVIVYPYQLGDEDIVASLPSGCSVVACPMSPHGKSLPGEIRLFFRLLRIIKKTRPDLVFNYTIKPNIYGGIASWCRNVPSVAVVPGLGYSFASNGLGGKLLRRLYLGSLRLSKRVFVLNESDRARLVRSGLNERKIVLLPGGEGVNLSRFPFTEGQYDSPRFLMVARLLYEKGYREFVDAAVKVKRIYPDASFEIAGSLNEANPTGIPRRVVASDERSGIIHYLGCIETISDELADPNTVVVLPSYYREGMNRSLMEACSCGRPVITTDLPGLKEMVVDEKNGYLVYPRDAESLSTAILSFMNLSEEKRKEMGRQSRRIAEQRFDVNSVLSIYDNVIAQILKPNV